MRATWWLVVALSAVGCDSGGGGSEVLDDVGVTPDGDFTRPGNWNGLLSAGPFGPLATGESLTVTFAVVCGADSLAVLEHAAAVQAFYDSGFESIVALEDPAALVDLAVPVAKRQPT